MIDYDAETVAHGKLAETLQSYGLLEGAFVIHDIFMFLYIIIYFLGFISGVQTIFILRHRSDFTLKNVFSIITHYTLNLFSRTEYERPADQKAWGVAWVAVCLSTIATFLFFIKNTLYAVDGGSREISLGLAFPWELAHLCGATATLLFHIAASSAAKNAPELLDE